MSNYASGYSLEPRLCVKTETVITYPSLYPHIYGRGNCYLSEKQALVAQFQPNFSRELVEFRPVNRFEWVRTNPPFWLSSGFQNMQAHNISAFLLKPVYAINYLPNFSNELVECRPVYIYRGGGEFKEVRTNPLLVEQWLLQNT